MAHRLPPPLPRRPRMVWDDPPIPDLPPRRRIPRARVRPWEKPLTIILWTLVLSPFITIAFLWLMYRSLF